MTENKIKEMLLDIINNGSKYEGKHPQTHCINSEKYGCNGCNECGHCWSKYKLGNEIHPDWEYHKVEKWYVFDYEDNDYRIFKDDIDCGVPCVFEGTKEECEKWVEEHTKKTWLEGFIEDNTTSEDRAMAYMASKEVCKKILEEVKDNCFKSWMPQVSEDVYNVLKNLIKDLGVEV